jgi:hypothetical protein
MAKIAAGKNDLGDNLPQLELKERRLEVPGSAGSCFWRIAPTRLLLSQHAQHGETKSK